MNFQDWIFPNFKLGELSLEAESKLSSGLKDLTIEFVLLSVGVCGSKIIGFVVISFIITLSKKAKI